MTENVLGLICSFAHKQLKQPPNDDDAYAALTCVHFALQRLLPTAQCRMLNAEVDTWLARRIELRNTEATSVSNEDVYPIGFPNGA